MPKTTPIPAGIVDAVKRELAETPPNEKGGIIAIAERFGITTQTVQYLQQRHKADINELRELIGRSGMEVAALSLVRINERLQDDAEMAKTPLRDIAMTYDKTVSASVTALEGHAPTIAKIDFTAIQVRSANLEAWDAKMAARRAEADAKRVIEAEVAKEEQG